MAIPLLQGAKHRWKWQPVMRPEGDWRLLTSFADFLHKVQPEKVIHWFIGKDHGNKGLPNGKVSLP
jgi:hypothetical protein